MTVERAAKSFLRRPCERRDPYRAISVIGGKAVPPVHVIVADHDKAVRVVIEEPDKIGIYH
jgi:hypothetical protein